MIILRVFKSVGKRVQKRIMYLKEMISFKDMKLLENDGEVFFCIIKMFFFMGCQKFLGRGSQKVLCVDKREEKEKRQGSDILW